MSFRKVSILLLMFLMTFYVSACVPLNGVSDGYIIAGHVTGSIGGQTLIKGNAVIVKLDAEGNLDWETNLELGSIIYSVQKTNDGGYVAAGYVSQLLDGHGENSPLHGLHGEKLYLVKLNSHGRKQWEKTLGDMDWCRGHFVQQTKDGGYIITGEVDIITDEIDSGGGWHMWLVKVNSKGNIEWDNVYEKGQVNSVLQVEDGGYIVAGAKNSYPSTSYDVCIAKINEDGVIEWEKTIHSDTWGSFSSISQTQDGGYILTGRQSMTDIWLIKMDKDGDVIWDKTIGDASVGGGYSVEPAQDGGYIFTGRGRLIKTDADGEIMWERVVTGATDIKDNEDVRLVPVGQVDEGYLIALKKFTFEGPLRDSTGLWTPTPLISQQLIFTKFNLDGDIEWEKTHDLPIKK
jgi:hypothetical protein